MTDLHFSDILNSMAQLPLKKHLLYSFLGGIATALGATVGFAIVIWILTQILSQLGGLPIIGELLANVVDATNNALDRKR